ncbi:MAG: hypothetical protein ABI867_05965 [Kofleriaceae bacterium]
MKNAAKPTLSLTRETLVKLTPDNLAKVVGGLGDIQATQSCCLWNSCVGVPVPTPPKK